MYKVIGIDNKEYGPVSAEQIKKWIEEGRVNEKTPVKAEETGEWKPLGEYPEFADALLAKQKLAPPSIPPVATVSIEEISARDYHFSVGECVEFGFNLFKNNFGILFGASILYLVINIGVGALTAIPILGILFVLVQIVIAGPLYGGLTYLFIKKVRGEWTDIGDLFYGFKSRFLQLVLVYIVMVLLVALSGLPGALIAFGSVALGIVTSKILAVIGLIIGIIIALIPCVYLSICWSYSVPLVIDKKLDFWDAMKLSFKKVSRHWFLVFFLFFVCGLINLLGLILCGIGFLFAFPISLASIMYGYEKIFGEGAPKTN